MPNIDTILRDHVTLKLECLDRLYLNGYQPLLQTEGGLLHFLLVHRKQPIPSPALLGQLTRSFVGAIESFAEEHHIPLVHFEKGQRKEDIAKQHFARFSRPEGVVFIGVAQEKVKAPPAPSTVHSRQSVERPPAPLWTIDCRLLTRGAAAPDFGPAFVKFSSYCPFTIRVWVNGHEWAKRQFPRSHRYLVTPEGRRIALFFSKTYARVLRPGLDRLDAPPPVDTSDPLRTAWRSLDQALSKLVDDARLAA